MKKIIRFGAVLAITCCSFSNLSAATDGDLTIEVNNLRNNNGRVLLALTQSAAPTDKAFVRADMAASNTEGVKIVLKAVPEGAYFIHLFHDENGNMKMDMTPEEKPAEGFLTAPVEIGQEDQTTKVNVVYL